MSSKRGKTDKVIAERPVSLRLQSADFAAIESLADSELRSVSNMAVVLLREALAYRGHKIEDALAVSASVAQVGK